MEEVILRFPHLSVQVFQQLDVQSLVNCKEVSGSWANLIEIEKPLNDIFVIMRLIHQHWKNFSSSLEHDMHQIDTNGSQLEDISNSIECAL